MKILRVIAGLDPEKGGPISVFSSAVIASMRAGADIECLTLEWPERAVATCPDYQMLVSNGIQVHVFHDLCSACLHIWRQASGIDILHIDGCWDPLCIAGAMLAKLRGLKLAVTPHESLTVSDQRRTSSRIRKLAKAVLSKIYQRATDCILYSSPLEQTDSVSHRGSVVIPHPVFDDATSAIPVRVKAGLRSERRIKIGYLGRFHPKKRIEDIIEAARHSPNLDLLIAGNGSGDYAAGLRARSDGCDNVVWLGFVETARREQFFAEIDFLVLASDYECFGMAAAEALVRGVPVITTDRVGVADDIRRWRAGYVVDIGVPSLQQAFMSCSRLGPEEYQELQRGALKAAAGYSYSAHGRAQLAAYARLEGGAVDDVAVAQGST